MQLDSKKLSLIISIAIFIFLCGGFFVLYRLINNNYISSEQKLSDWRVEAARRDEIKALNNSLKVIAVEKESFETHFAQSSNIVPFLDNLEKLGTDAGAEAHVSAVEISKDGSYLLVGVNASGYFESLYKYLMLLENSPYELEFTLVDFQDRGGGEVGTISEWSATFKIKLLSFVK